MLNLFFKYINLSELFGGVKIFFIIVELILVGWDCMVFKMVFVLFGGIIVISLFLLVKYKGLRLRIL